MKIAIIHDWLVTYGGSERVLEQMLLLYPDADLYSLVNFLPLDKKEFVLNKTVNTSFLQKVPFARHKYRYFLPLMPFAVEQFDFSNYDLVISSSHAVAKGIISNPNQLHLSYIYSPMRYIWDLKYQYLDELKLNKGIRGIISKYIIHRLRQWDINSALSIDAMVTLSRFVQKRIYKYYRRKAEIIYPPVDMNSFSIQEKKSDFYLTVSRLVPYKKIDLIVEAFSYLPNKKLIVVGEGPELKKIKSKATKNIELMGFQSSSVVKNLMQEAKAFIFAAVEDFGIAPLEAQACGTPVIALGKGGLLETVINLGHPSPTGLFFQKQEVSDLIDATSIFEKNLDKFSPINCRNNATRFSTAIFKSKFRNFVETNYDKFQSPGRF